MFRKKKDTSNYIRYEADEGYDYYNYNQYNQGFTHDSTINRDEPTEAKTGSTYTPKLVIVAGIYILFLIIGIITTTYGLGPDGKKHAQMIPVSLREEREEYYRLKEHYTALKEITNVINSINTQYNSDAHQDSYSLSLKYEGLLPAVDKDMSVAKTLTIRKHGILKELLVNVYEDTSTYLAKKSTALTRKDKSVNDEAENIRKQLESDYIQLSEDMKSLSKRVQLNDETLYDIGGGKK